MSVFIKHFGTTSEYNAYTADTRNFILPNVSLCDDENEVHFTPYVPVPETRVMCIYETDYEGEEAQLLSNTEPVAAIEVDGVTLPEVTSYYTFETGGEHTVYLTMKNPTEFGGDGNEIFDSVNSNLKSVTLPDCVEVIRAEAFYQCPTANCTLGSGVTEIEDEAFYNMFYIESLTIKATTPPTLTSYNFIGGETPEFTIYVPAASLNTYRTTNIWSDYSGRIEPIE